MESRKSRRGVTNDSLLSISYLGGVDSRVDSENEEKWIPFDLHHDSTLRNQESIATPVGNICF